MEMLRRTGKPMRKRVKALTDPQPEFVSLVGAGANKTPFRAMRADVSGLTPGARPYDIARIDFSSEQFADAEAVNAWLADGGYEDMTVEKTEAGWSVASEIAEGTEVSLIEDPSTGVTLHVVANPDALSQKADEMTRPFERAVKAAEALGAKGADHETILADVGPVIMDETFSAYTAIRDALLAGDVTGARAALTEFGGMFDTLLDVFPGEATPAMKAFVDALAPEVEMTKETIAAKEEDQLDAVSEETAVEAEAAVEETAEEEQEAEEAVKEEDAAEADAPEAEAAEETEAEAVANAEEEAEDEVVEEAAKSEEEATDPMAALADMMAGLAKSVEALTETVSKSAENQEQLAQRVEAMEESRQTRKGADVDETATSKKSERSITDEMSELRTRSMLGMR